jgi:hypothetical protein
MANLEKLLERLVSERLEVLGRVCNEQTGRLALLELRARQRNATEPFEHS